MTPLSLSARSDKIVHVTREGERKSSPETMAKLLILDRQWRSKNALLDPGNYKIPGDILMSYARCAVADGAGTIAAVSPAPLPPLTLDKKAFLGAPENKATYHAGTDSKTAANRSTDETDSSSGDGTIAHEGSPDTGTPPGPGRRRK